MRPGAHGREEQKERGRNRQQVSTQPRGNEREQRTAHKQKKASAQPGGCSTRRRSARRCWWTGHLGCLRPTGAYEPGDPRLDLHEREERTEVPHSDAQRERSTSTDRILFLTRLQRAARYCSVSTLPAPVLDAQGPQNRRERHQIFYQIRIKTPRFAPKLCTESHKEVSELSRKNIAQFLPNLRKISDQPRTRKSPPKRDSLPNWSFTCI